MHKSTDSFIKLKANHILNAAMPVFLKPLLLVKILACCFLDINHMHRKLQVGSQVSVHDMTTMIGRSGS